MARRRISPEFYESLLAAFRDEPGNAAHAARGAGCDARTSMRAWVHGWPSVSPNFKPIKDMLMEEREAARTAARREEEEKRRAAVQDRELSRADAVECLKQESNMLKVGRVNILSGLVSLSMMLPAVKKVCAALVTRIDGGDLPDTRELMGFLRNWSVTGRNLTSAAQALIESERLRKGDPTEIIGLQIEGALTVEEATREIEEAAGLLILAKERGLLTVDEDGSGGSMH